MRNDIIWIRVFATVLVVLGHCEFYNGFSGFVTESIPGINDNTIWNLICRVIYSFHMALFFGISGSLLAYSIKKHGIKSFSFTKFIKKKCVRLILPFLVVSFFYCIPIKIFTGKYDANSIDVGIYEHIVLARDSHLWYLLALFWCMLWGGCLLFCIKKKVLWQLFLFLTLLIHFVSITFWCQYFCLSHFFRYIIFFIFGFIVDYYSKTIFIRRIKSTPPYIYLIIFVILDYLYITHHQVHGWLWPKISFLLFDAIGVISIIFFICIAQKLTFQVSPNKVIKYLDRHSYEIYLYSEPLNYIILYFCVISGGWFYGDSALFFLRFVFTLLGSLLVLSLVKINYGQK